MSEGEGDLVISQAPESTRLLTCVDTKKLQLCNQSVVINDQEIRKRSATDLPVFLVHIEKCLMLTNDKAATIEGDVIPLPDPPCEPPGIPCTRCTSRSP